MCVNNPRDILQVKKQARRAALRRRDALSSSMRRKKSSLICETFLQSELFQQARCLFTYVSVRSEVDTAGIVNAALSLGKTVCAPLIDVTNKEMIACAIRDPERDLHPGTMGIPEPDLSFCPMVLPGDVDCVLVPSRQRLAAYAAT